MDAASPVWRHRCYLVNRSKLSDRLVIDEIPYGWLSGYRQRGIRVYQFQDQKARLNTYIVIYTREHCFKYAEWVYNSLDAPGFRQTISLNFWKEG